MKKALRVVVLASGRGSNFRALQRAIDEGHCAAEIVALVSDKKTCGALEFAAERGILCESVRRRSFASRAEWDEALSAAMARHEPDLIVLAGFMRIVGEAVLARFGGRIINVHPSILPAFPGLDAPAQAVDKGVRISGCTVHLVDAGVDTGPILAQAAVAVHPNDTAETLHARIQPMEHRLLPQVVAWVADQKIELTPLRSYLEGAEAAVLGTER